VKKISVPTAGC